MSWIKRPIHRFKYKFSEPYRIKIGVGVSPLRSKREKMALIEFCKNELKDREHMKLNPERSKIYMATLLLYKQGLSDNPEVYTKIRRFQLREGDPIKYYNDVDTFIDDHVGWYWN